MNTAGPPGPSGTISVRRAQPGDAAAIGRVHVQAWQESYAGLLPHAAIAQWTVARRTAMWRDALVRGTARGICIAELDGAIIGFGACADQRVPQLKARGFTGEITAIYVLRASQRCGAGRLLMAALARRLLAEGNRAMALWVLAANDRARAFYERLGGIDLGLRRSDAPGQEEAAYGWDVIAALATPGRAA